MNGHLPVEACLQQNTADRIDNNLFYFMQVVQALARPTGNGLLAHEILTPTSQPHHTWTANTGRHRLALPFFAAAAKIARFPQHPADTQVPGATSAGGNLPADRIRLQPLPRLPSRSGMTRRIYPNISID
ncbi:MAG: hypothetical protein HWE39_25575 [Oceanospirillaceae bacterium]|nr:hypothetical protein [Oceanospirillaceae bacterium]